MLGCLQLGRLNMEGFVATASGDDPKRSRSDLNGEVRRLLTSLENDLPWLGRNRSPGFAGTIDELQQIVDDIRAEMPILPD